MAASTMLLINLIMVYSGMVTDAVPSECQPGTYLSHPSETCHECLAGTYQNQSGQTQCLKCSYGTYQPRNGGTSCIVCAAGTYQNNWGGTLCLKCEPGKYQAATGQYFCNYCPPGSYSVSDATSCTPCEIGTYRSGSEQSCVSCESGKTTSQSGSVSYDDCIPACPAGSYYPWKQYVSWQTCVECQAGSYSNSGTTSCTPCAVGTYQGRRGQSSCSPCGDSKTTNEPGADSYDDCIPECQPGTYLSSSSNACHECVAGTYQNQSGQTNCPQCSLGTHQPRTGATSCIVCDAGTYQDKWGGTNCVKCQPGRYQDVAGQTVCKYCALGTYSLSGATSCTPCEIGTYRSSYEILCIPCESGKTTSKSGSDSYHDCIPGDTAKKGNDSEVSTTNVGVIAGGAGGAIAVILVVVIVLFIAVRQYRLKEVRSNETSRQDNILSSPSNIHLEICIEQQKGEVVYTNLEHEEENALLPLGAITLSELWDYVQHKTLDGSKLSEEFQTLPSGLLSATNEALKACNCQKNRYKGLFPYDSTRVKLLPLGEDRSDYINASFIDGYCRPKAYIASQGPTSFNINDFWRMIYQQDVEKIVMLTRLFEVDSVKCLQYWPDEGSEQYGRVKVILVHLDTFAEYDIRTLAMTVENTTKQVIQFHFTAWPDKGVPEAASSIVQFWHKVRNVQSHNQSPTVVHCSAGIGRTGTYIALDYLVDQGKDKQYVNIFPCVAQLRRQRVNLVQTEAQYRFLHEALVEALMVSGSAVSAEKFPSVYKELLEIERKQRKNGLLIEFEKLVNECNKAVYHQDGNDNGGEEEENEARNVSSTHTPQHTSRLEINQHKYRDSNIPPADEYRPYLSLLDGRTDYIDAIKLPSHRQKDGLIATQMPREDTMIDFWRLVYDYGVRTIVMLNVLPSNNEGIKVYWPSKGESMTEKMFNIENVDENGDNTDYLWRTIRLTKDGEQPRKIRQFQCKFWPGSEKVPLQTDAILKLIDGVEQWQRQADIKTVVVHCMNGAERSGLYCVLTTVLERLNVERDVAIYQTVKKMRTRRQQIIPNFEQYKYCHDVVLEYLGNFGTYSNFSAI